MWSAPSVAVDAANNEYVFWEGANGALMEAWWTGTWNGPANLGSYSGHMGSAPSAGVSSSQQNVWWQGTDGNLYEAFYNDSTGQWTGPMSLGLGHLDSQPGATDAGGVQFVFWDRGGDLIEAWYSGAWQTSDLGAGPIASAPSVAVDPTTAAQWVFFDGQGGGGVFDDVYSGSWQPGYVGGGASPSSPSATSPGGEVDAFFQGTDGYLYEWRHTSSWQGAYGYPIGPV
jgi:hypothetical protein